MGTERACTRPTEARALLLLQTIRKCRQDDKCVLVGFCVGLAAAAQLLARSLGIIERMESHVPTQQQQLLISGFFGLHSLAAAWLATFPLLETVRVTYYLMELEQPELIRWPPRDFNAPRMYRLVRWGVYIANELRAWRRAVLPHWRLISALGIYFATETTGFMYHSKIAAFNNQVARGAEFGLFFWLLQRLSDGVVTGFEELIPFPRKWPVRRRHFANAICYTVWGACMGYLWSVPLGRILRRAY